MIDLRPYPLSRSIAAWAPFRRSADADRAGNDPSRAARQTGRVSENRPRAGAYGPYADCGHCRVLAPVTGVSAHIPLPNNASSRNARRYDAPPAIGSPYVREKAGTLDLTIKKNPPWLRRAPGGLLKDYPLIFGGVGRRGFKREAAGAGRARWQAKPTIWMLLAAFKSSRGTPD